MVNRPQVTFADPPAGPSTSIPSQVSIAGLANEIKSPLALMHTAFTPRLIPPLRLGPSMQVHSPWCSSPDPVGQPIRTVLCGLFAYLHSLFYAALLAYALCPPFLPLPPCTHYLTSKTKQRKMSHFMFKLGAFFYFISAILSTEWVC